MASSTPASSAHPLALPESLSPDSIDTLTELSAILSRLRPPQSSSTAAGAAAGQPPSSTTSATAGTAPGAGPTPTTQHGGGLASSAVTGTTPLPASTPGGTASGGAGGALALKDVPAATDSLKHKLQRARAQVRALPDMGRGVAEQEAEIEQLEARAAAQRAVLARLREVGMRFSGAGGGAGTGGGADGEGDTKMEM